MVGRGEEQKYDEDEWAIEEKEGKNGGQWEE